MISVPTILRWPEGEASGLRGEETFLGSIFFKLRRRHLDCRGWPAAVSEGGGGDSPLCSIAGLEWNEDRVRALLQGTPLLSGFRACLERGRARRGDRFGPVNREECAILVPNGDSVPSFFYRAVQDVAQSHSPKLAIGWRKRCSAFAEVLRVVLHVCRTVELCCHAQVCWEGLAVTE